MVRHDDDLRHALELMEERGYHYAITLVNDHHRPVGMVLALDHRVPDGAAAVSTTTASTPWPMWTMTCARWPR
ncbi:MAG: CBS domain-containing protein [Arhodomonas sp.]|nr:CBS domain-containing protein [Arhodomonas sp.]